MKKIFAIAAVALMMAGGQAYAQERDSGRGPKGNKGDKPSRAEMVEHMSRRMAEELALDEPTAEKFVPLYSAFKNEIHEVLAAAPKAGKDASDAEIEASIKAKFQASRQVLDIREAYYDKFREILTPRQIQKLYKSEGRKVGAHNGGPGHGGGRPGGPGNGRRGGRGGHDFGGDRGAESQPEEI